MSHVDFLIENLMDSDPDKVAAELINLVPERKQETAAREIGEMSRGLLQESMIDAIMASAMADEVAAFATKKKAELKLRWCEWVDRLEDAFIKRMAEANKRTLAP